MCVLIISYKPEADEMSMRCVVGHFNGGAYAKWCETGEEAIDHVARLNAFNEKGSPEYEHFFIYPDKKCPYEEQDSETGEMVYKICCEPLSKVDLDLANEYGGIPEHFRAPIAAREAAYRKKGV